MAARGKKGRLSSVELDERTDRVRPPRHVRRAPACVLPPRAGGRPYRLRRFSRDLRAGRHSSRGGSRGRGRGWRDLGRGARTLLQRCGRQGEVLRLHLRGRHGQGRQAGDRGGLRLDRAGQALHDGDDGALPGQALPPPLHAALRPRERDRRGDDRNDDRAAAVAARVVRSARRPAARAGGAHVHPPPPQGAGRDDDVDGDVAPPALVRRPRRRGEERPRRPRRDRRLHPRQAAGHRARRRPRSSSACTRTASAT